MKKSKFFWLFSILFIIFLVSACVSPDEVENEETNLENNQEQQETELNHEDLVKEYIKENISQLSPESEVLGGTFYVTNIDFVEDNMVIVDYEDGHIALNAKAIFSVNDNEVEINSFELIPEGSTIERD